MLPLHVRHKHLPSSTGSLSFLPPSISARARLLISRYSKSRMSLFGGIALFLLALYLLWPSSLRVPPGLGYWGGAPGRPDYRYVAKSKRAEAVREAFLHAYGSYERVAAPDDELVPLRNESVQNFNGWGVSMYDALDTLLLMDLQPEFERALKHVEKTTFQRHPEYDAMFFETVIRYLGGLLSAYALSGRAILRTKADELGHKLSPVFKTQSGLAAFAVNTDNGTFNFGPRHGSAVLAEFASCQMEYKYLAHLTDNHDYFKMADRANDWLVRNQLENGMWYTMWNVTTALPLDLHLTIGAWADSAYEYLLKEYLLSGRTETRLRDMYLKSVRGILNDLLFLSPTRRILYVTDVYGGSSSSSPSSTATQDPSRAPFVSRRFEHLSCFLPGLLALGAHTLRDEIPQADREMHEWAAAGLAHSCWLMYADQPSGLAPEEVVFDGPTSPAAGQRKVTPPQGNPKPTNLKIHGNDEALEDERWVDAVERWRKEDRKGRPPGVPGATGTGPGVAMPMPRSGKDKKDYFSLNTKYLLRPETIESLYVMWRTTGDEVWRERAWGIFLAIEANCRMHTGYASVVSVNREVTQPIDEMPSYALAETWKYLYLTFLDHDPLPMDKYVFNTEAHPLPIFEWSKNEKEAFGFL